ncbi:7359_t:CDS:2 [Funneliformis geosporum]|nr:7359_t:CDS:2 [Funneliformis geosporum]
MSIGICSVVHGRCPGDIWQTRDVRKSMSGTVRRTVGTWTDIRYLLAKIKIHLYKDENCLLDYYNEQMNITLKVIMAINVVETKHVGLHGPVNKINSNEIYGVLPYVAPEILKGNPPTKASDIYSFGIIMWTLSAGIRPWCNKPHDLKLAKEICSGLRPEIIDGTPNVYIQLMTQCLHSDSSKRPTASQLYESIEDADFHFTAAPKFGKRL